MAEKSIVGDLINFRGLVYSPINENGVVFLFGKIAHDLNMYVEEIKPGFPDCVARRFVGKGWERVRIEFEFQSSNFVAHKHDPKECDIIVCWEHDWKDCPLEVIELRSEIKGLPNPPISRPESIEVSAASADEKVAAILKRVNANKHVGQWFTAILDALRAEDDSVWANPGEIYIGLYSPEKSFASVKLQATSIRIECFSGGQPLNGTRVSSERWSPRWAKFSIKSEDDVAKAITILKESRRRLKEAIKNGEPTAFFSGGEFSTGSPSPTIDEIDEDKN
jgi:hypothetical protein